MTTLLEALVTAGGRDTSEVGYKLRKRMAALIVFWVPEIENEVKKLYKQRSDFAHGSFFEEIHKQIKLDRDSVNLPMPPFEFLAKQKENIRLTLVAYLYLNKVFKLGREQFGGCGSVLDILEKSLIDVGLRERLRVHVEAILSLCPRSEVRAPH